MERLPAVYQCIAYLLADFCGNFIGRFYGNQPIFVWHTTDKIRRYDPSILSATNSAVKLSSKYAENIGRLNRLILSFVCHRQTTHNAVTLWKHYCSANTG